MLGFQWDQAKAENNLLKHSVSFEEAASVFGDPLGRITKDLRHSRDEERFVLLGRSGQQRWLAVMFTDRGEDIRIISARLATSPERRQYEKFAQEE